MDDYERELRQLAAETAKVHASSMLLRPEEQAERTRKELLKSEQERIRREKIAAELPEAAPEPVLDSRFSSEALILAVPEGEVSEGEVEWMEYSTEENVEIEDQLPFKQEEVIEGKIPTTQAAYEAGLAAADSELAYIASICPSVRAPAAAAGLGTLLLERYVAQSSKPLTTSVLASLGALARGLFVLAPRADPSFAAAFAAAAAAVDVAAERVAHVSVIAPSAVLILRLVGVVWSSSDARHAVVTPALLAAEHALTVGAPENGVQQLVTTQLLIDTCLSLTARSGALVPALVPALCRVLTAAAAAAAAPAPATTRELGLSDLAVPGDDVHSAVLNSALRSAAVYCDVCAGASAHPALVHALSILRQAVDAAAAAAPAADAVLACIDSCLARFTHSFAPLALLEVEPPSIPRYEPRFQEFFRVNEDYDEDAQKVAQRSARRQIRYLERRDHRNQVRDVRAGQRAAQDAERRKDRRDREAAGKITAEIHQMASDLNRDSKMSAKQKAVAKLKRTPVRRR